MSLFFDSRSILAAAAELGDSFDPRIGAHSLFRENGAVVTVSAETTNGEKENGYLEGLTHDFWRPGTSGIHWLRVRLSAGAQSANYIGIAAHDLHLHNGSIKAQHSTDGGATWVDTSSDFAPGDSSPIMILYDGTNAGDHRLWVNSTSAVSIGVIHIGRVLSLDAPMQGPWAPPTLARANRYINGVSEGGAFLGRSLISEGARLQVNIRGAAMEWIRDEWEATVRLLESRGFFFAARDISVASGSEAEVFYGWAEGQPAARYETNVYGGISLAARGIVT